LRLPGHTADGGYVNTTADGGRHIVWSNGTERIESESGTPGRVLRSGADGSFTEHFWGPHPEDNFDFERTADGRHLTNGVDRLATIEDRIRHESGDHTQELERLQHVRDGLRDFEERAARDGLSHDEVARTYREVTRLLEAEDSRDLSRAERFRLADEIMHH